LAACGAGDGRRSDRPRNDRSFWTADLAPEAPLDTVEIGPGRMNAGLLGGSKSYVQDRQNRNEPTRFVPQRGQVTLSLAGSARLGTTETS
jgi:hypothetical protein